jgi:hypothetical protein
MKRYAFQDMNPRRAAPEAEVYVIEFNRRFVHPCHPKSQPSRIQRTTLALTQRLRQRCRCALHIAIDTSYAKSSALAEPSAAQPVWRS